MTTFSDVFDFISRADETELNRMVEGIKLRRKFIHQDRAAQLRIGDTVTLTALSPKVLNGLRGVVKTFGPNNRTVAVLLDPDSTTLLGLSRTRFASAVPLNGDPYLLRAVPATCCVREEP